MNEPFTDQIIAQIDQAAELYYRLLLVVAPSGHAKTAVLQEVARRTGAPYVNVNLELSRRLLGLTERRRTLDLPGILGDIATGDDVSLVLLDNIEILFDAALKQDPLRLLQSVSRNRTVVAAWNGTIDRGHLIYAVPGHPEYRRYPIQDLLVVSLERGI
ncbi:MAG: BREX-3 system P-loop-containing protein BrxF [Anaerolineae bacterium]|nr:BREX-3 system P-loop-containing protein BrxF [Anaerolineae bacterium]